MLLPSSQSVTMEDSPIKLFLCCLISLELIFIKTSSAESGFFWHVSDFHYDPTYLTSKLSCENVLSTPEMFGGEACDSSWPLVEGSINEMASIKRNVDFVLWTGDSVAHIPDSNKNVASNIEIIQNLTNLFNKSFGQNVKFLPSIGNHDVYPSDQAPVDQNELYTGLAQVWREWIDNNDEVTQFSKGGFYTMQLSPRIRLMAMNTNLYNDRNRITKAMADPAGQFAWMERVLEKARNNKEKVIVTGHITPGVITPHFSSRMYEDHQKRYVSILTRYHDVIIASHYGHDHTDGFKIIQDEDDDSKSVAQFVAPSVAPQYPIHSPAFRLVEFDALTGRHLNYMQYYVNLTVFNRNKLINWAKLYDFRAAYKVPDMSIQSLRTIFTKMAVEDDAGKGLAQTYCNNALVSREDKECTRKNQFEIVCGGEHYDLTQANKCVEGYISPGTASSNLGVHLMCIVLTVFLIIDVLYGLLA